MVTIMKQHFLVKLFMSFVLCHPLPLALCHPYPLPSGVHITNAPRTRQGTANKRSPMATGDCEEGMPEG